MMTELTHEEYIELSFLYLKGFRWLVRNEIGSVQVFVNKPHRDKETNYTPFGKTKSGYDFWIETKTPISLEEQRRREDVRLGSYKFITWRDEPMFIEDLIKRDYFLSTAHELIFTLLELSGEDQTDILGITPFLYSNPEAAKQWRDSIENVILPVNHAAKEKALHVLNKFYKQMIGE